MIRQQKDRITTCPHSCDKQMNNVCQNINSPIYGRRGGGKGTDNTNTDPHPVLSQPIAGLSLGLSLHPLAVLVPGGLYSPSIHPSIPSCWRCTRGDAEGGGPRGQHTKSAGAALGAPRPGAALGPGGARSSRGRRNKGGRRRAQQARNPAELWGRCGSPPRSPGGSHPPLSLRLFVL